MSQSETTTREPTNEELELLGLSKSQDHAFIDDILQQLGRRLVSARRTTEGNNTTTFILSTKVSTKEGGTQTERPAFYVAGTEAIPSVDGEAELKMVFSTSLLQEDMDQKLLVANRVAAMQLVRQHGSYAGSLTPAVYAWSDGNHSHVRPDQTWCLMEFKEGVPVASLWEESSVDTRIKLVQGMAKVYAAMQKTPLPVETPTFGAFTFEDPSQRNSAILVGPSCFHYGGPYHSISELYRGYIDTQYEALKTKAPRLKGWSGSQVQTRFGEMDLADALGKFHDKLDSSDSFRETLFQGLELPPILVHGDFNFLNVMVHPTTLEPTALLDFEFAQSGPVLDEFFQSFGPEGLLVQGSRACPEDPREKEEWEIGQSLLMANPPELAENANDEAKLASAYVAALKEHGAIGPWSFDPKVVDRCANLYWFAQELCSGLMQRETFWTTTEPQRVKRREMRLKETRLGLEKDMKRWL